MPRIITEMKLQVGSRTVAVRAMDSIGPEDCFEVAMLGVLHRYLTGEDVVAPVARDVKDFMIRTNLI